MPNKKIVSNAGFCSGEPRLEDTRLTCGNIVNALRHLSVEEYAQAQALSVRDVILALEFCAEEKCIDLRPANFCTDCIHDKRGSIEPEVLIENAQDIKEFAMRSASGKITGQAYLLIDEMIGRPEMGEPPLSMSDWTKIGTPTDNRIAPGWK